MDVIQIQKSIRELTAQGSLRDLDLESLSGQDASLVAAYLEALDQESGDATLEDVGQDFGVTRERVRQILAKGLRKLKHPARSRQLGPHVDMHWSSAKRRYDTL